MMHSDKKEKKSGLTLDWLVGGALTRIGDTVDRLTGRGWNPSSSLATSKLSEKLCFLLDEEAREGDRGGKFAPHIITLKMQWNKFSSDSDEELLKLRDELHAAAIDHINDKLYHTYAPIEIVIKTDYFTEGVRIIGSFGKYGSDSEDAAVNVTLPNIIVERTSEGSRASIDLSEEVPVPKPILPNYVLRFEINGRSFEQQLDFGQTKRYTIGRGKESGIAIEHPSVSKVHASLVLNSEGKLLLADTGSTNGTYVAGKRISYGKAAEIVSGETIKFGAVAVDIKIPQHAALASLTENAGVIETPLTSTPRPAIVSESVSEASSAVRPAASEPRDSGDHEQNEVVAADDSNSDLANDQDNREDSQI